MRNAFSKCLVEAGLRDPGVLLLTGDHGYALFDDFRRECPQQYINAGVAEQNMVGVAAGLAKGGFRPVVYGLSAFVPIRVLEQIKLDVCYEQLPVIFIGDGAGVVYSHLGSSHQSTEDVAALRRAQYGDPFARRRSRNERGRPGARGERPRVFAHGKGGFGRRARIAAALEWGHLCPLRRGHGPIAWIATGSMVKTALAAADNWPGSSVYSAPCIKPLDEIGVTEICRRASRCRRD